MLLATRDSGLGTVRELPFYQQRLGEVDLGAHVAGIDAQRLLKMLDGLVVLLPFGEDAGEVVVSAPGGGVFP